MQGDSLLGMVRRVAYDEAAANVDTGNGGVSAQDYQDTDIQLSVMAVLGTWAHTDDLDSGETMADRLYALLVGVADESGDSNGELSDDEEGILEIAAGFAVDGLVAFGASEADATALVQDGDDGVSDTLAELVRSKVDSENTDYINEFVFGEGSDQAVFDAVYKKKIVIKNGRKTIKMKRMSGFVKRTSKQKAAMKKARMKAFSGMAKMKRARSMAKRANFGLNK